MYVGGRWRSKCTRYVGIALSEFNKRVCGFCPSDVDTVLLFSTSPVKIGFNAIEWSPARGPPAPRL